MWFGYYCTLIKIARHAKTQIRSKTSRRVEETADIIPSAVGALRGTFLEGEVPGALLAIGPLTGAETLLGVPATGSSEAGIATGEEI